MPGGPSGRPAAWQMTPMGNRSPRRSEEMDKVNLREKFARFAEQWKPKIVGELNGQQVKLV